MSDAITEVCRVADFHDFAVGMFGVVMLMDFTAEYKSIHLQSDGK